MIWLASIAFPFQVDAGRCHDRMLNTQRSGGFWMRRLIDRTRIGPARAGHRATRFPDR